MAEHPDLEKWTDLATKQLRGRPLEDLNWKTWLRADYFGLYFLLILSRKSICWYHCSTILQIPLRLSVSAREKLSRPGLG